MIDEDDSGDGAATALSVRRADASRLRVARSLADAAPGEMVFVNRRGQALTRRRYKVMMAASWTVIVGSGPIVGLLYGVWFGPTAGVIAAACFGLFALARLRHWPAFRAAMARTAACQWEDAHAAFLALERKRLPAPQRRTAQVLLASLESVLGRPQQAIDRLASAQAGLSSRRWPMRVMRCHAAAIRAGALSTLGRFDEAWRARDDLAREAAAMAGASGRKPGDVVEMLVQATSLKIAADADRPDALPDDDTLHSWARAALGRTAFGEMLVRLAWAFHRRGDDDMARHLLAEAPPRIPRPSLAVTSPRLHAWASERAREWGVDLESPPLR
jgi:hypothetical protein